MVEISDEDFEAMVGAVFDSLPDDMVEPLQNVAVLIADQPSWDRPRLFGLYSGHPLTGRGFYGFDELRARVRVTLVHEIGHYFGLDDARLQELGWA